MNESEDSRGAFQMGDVAFAQSRGKLGSKYFVGFNGAVPSPTWFEVKVLYVKVSSCQVDESPELLRMHFPSRSIGTALEVNGGRISPSEEASLVLRRDRVDADSVEIIYVSTDHLRVVGSASFEIYDKEELLVNGTLEQLPDKQVYERFDSDTVAAKGVGVGWTMECACAIGPGGCIFTKAKPDYASIPFAPPSMEICVVGNYSGSPIILAQSVQLISRRRTARCLTLDAIPEDEECEKLDNPVFASANTAGQELEDPSFEDEGDKIDFRKMYLPEGMGYMENDDGEMSWFNAGVRVGVGIGLGMCLGIGIGVGLLVRTYQATTRSFRRRLF